MPSLTAIKSDKPRFVTKAPTQDLQEIFDQATSIPQGRVTVDRLASKDDERTAIHRTHGLSDSVAEAAIKEWVVSESYDEKSSIQSRLDAIKSRLKQPRRAAYASLAAAQSFGATVIRSTWSGFNDDGCFEHVILGEDGPIEAGLHEQLDRDIGEILSQRGCMADEENAGSVGILEINLLTGGATWTQGYGGIEGRLAEFLLACQKLGARSVFASLVCTGDRSGGQKFSITELQTAGAADDKQLSEALRWACVRMVADDDSEFSTLWRRFIQGTGGAVEVDVDGRTFVFRGSDIAFKVTVPQDALSVRSFIVKELASRGGG